MHGQYSHLREGFVRKIVWTHAEARFTHTINCQRVVTNQKKDIGMETIHISSFDQTDTINMQTLMFNEDLFVKN